MLRIIFVTLILIIEAMMSVGLTMANPRLTATDNMQFRESPELRAQDSFSHDTTGTYYLVHDGVPKAQIIIAPKAPTTVMLAARELRMAIWKMSGVLLPVRIREDKDISFKVFVGRSSYTDSLGISSDGCRDGGYKMLTGDDYLALIGDDEEYTILGPHSTRWSSERDSPYLYQKWYELTGATWNNEYISANSRKYDPEWDLWEADGRGSFNAVNEFLYDQGVRWYYPGPIGEIIPKKESIGFASVCKTVNPNFSLRHFYIYYMSFFGSDEDNILWQLRLRTNGMERYSAVPAAAAACSAVKPMTVSRALSAGIPIRMRFLTATSCMSARDSLLGRYGASAA